MRLRLQLILVSLFALCLPWAGCTYIFDMETALRESQQTSLLSTARAIGVMLSGQPEALAAMEITAPAAGTGAALYLQEVEQFAVADGYLDEWAGRTNYFRQFRSPNDQRGNGREERSPLVIDFYAAADTTTAYLIFRVAVKDTVTYHNPSEAGIANGDHVRLVMTNRDDAVKRYWLAPEAPGEIIARTLREDQILLETRVRGAWRDTDNGYQLEISLPIKMLGDRLGFTVFGKGLRPIGSMTANGDPGRLVRADAALTEPLNLFFRDNLQLSVVDAENWLLVKRGALEHGAPNPEAAPPGTWILEALYRWIMTDANSAADYEVPVRGKLVRKEVNNALAGIEQANWYANNTADNGAIISAAFPLRRRNQILGAVVVEQTSEQILSLTSAAMTRLLFITLAATLVIGAGLIGYASWLSFRISRLSRNVNAVIAPDGRLLDSFPQNWGSDEIGDLGRNFGQLLARMHEYTEYLRTLASKLSHELRTPLAVVRSSLDNLEHASLPEGAAGYLQRAHQGSVRLSHILNAMSAASRVEESIKQAERGPVVLNSFLETIVDGYRSAYPHRTINLAVPDERVSVNGSADLLAQMLDKLMDNAADFCTEFGEITFGLASGADGASITVSNDGPLLPKRMTRQLFDSMVSVREGKTENPHLGLGLAIVRLVAEFHHGSVRAENRADATGVSFIVHLPRR